MAERKFLKRKHSAEEIPEKFYTSIDDSSDEEDSVEQYDIKIEIEKFKTSCREHSFPCKYSNILSFIGHAVGIYVLYNPEVQKRYYELKGKQLKQERSTVLFLNEGEIKEVIQGQFNCIERFAGKNWIQQRDNCEIMKKNFKIMESDWPSLIIEHKLSYFKHFRKGLEYHLEQTLVTKSFKPDFMPNFSRNFQCPFPLRNFQRKTLDNVKFDLSAVAQDQFPVEFLAHLRLHNRSEKRHTLNHEQCKDTSWRIFQTDVEEAVVKLNNQRLVCNGTNKPFYNRNEHVYLSGNKGANYSAFFSCQDKNEFPILLKNRLNIKKGLDGKCLSENISSLWYLLFGCAVITNPAAIIHNNMVLDIAEALYVDERKELGYDYENIIADLPMSAPGIVKQAMELNKCYGYLMPYNYQYRYVAPVENANDLIEREAKITKKWLEFKLGKAASRYLITQCEFDNKAVETLWEVIAESFEKWGIKNV